MQIAPPRRGDPAPRFALAATADSGVERALTAMSARAQAGWVRVAMVLAVSAVFGLAWIDQRRNQQRSFEDFKAVEATLSRAASASIGARLDSVASDLRSIAAASRVSLPAALSVMGRVVERDAPAGLYRRAELIDQLHLQLQGGATLVADLPPTEGGLAAIAPALRGARDELLARMAGAPEGQVVLSAASSDAGGGPAVQLCGVRDQDRAVLLWVEVARLFDGIGGASGQAESRWLALDRASDRWLWLGGPGATGWLEAALATSPEVVEVRGLAGAGGQGALALEPEVARQFGLADRTAVAGYSPVRLGAAQPWSVVVVASAQRLRDRALIGRLRLAASTGVAALLVGLFGVVLSRQERRERGLAEKLRLAAVTAAMRQRNERMEKLATIGTLAAGVAHEVGTPLGIISGRAEQLLARVPDGDEGEAERRGLGSILTQVDRVSSTIRQLLDFARPRAVEAEVLAPATVLHGAAVLLEHRFQQAGVLLHLPPALPLPPMKADATQLEQALINLLNNACDACVDGGEVTARVYQRADQVAFEIGDSGSGITSENLPRVLDPFFTTKKRGQGTGLGLSIVADIVKNHGGLLEIESEPGKGTTVRILLRAEAEPEERP